jgi:hypothetical protein
MLGLTQLSEPSSSTGDPECIAAETTFDLPVLQDINGPISDEDFVGEPHQTLVSLPTLSAFHFFHNNADLSR